MTNGTSQGLLVIVAVIVFGIFVGITYLLFQEKLKVGLADIFDNSLGQAQKDLANEKEFKDMKGDFQMTIIPSKEFSEVSKPEIEEALKGSERLYNYLYSNQGSSSVAGEFSADRSSEYTQNISYSKDKREGQIVIYTPTYRLFSGNEAMAHNYFVKNNSFMNDLNPKLKESVKEKIDLLISSENLKGDFKQVTEKDIASIKLDGKEVTGFKVVNTSKGIKISNIDTSVSNFVPQYRSVPNNQTGFFNIITFGLKSGSVLQSNDGTLQRIKDITKLSLVTNINLSEEKPVAIPDGKHYIYDSNKLPLEIQFTNGYSVKTNIVFRINVGHIVIDRGQLETVK